MQTHKIIRRNATGQTHGTDPSCRRGDVTIPGCDVPRASACDVQMVNGVLRGLAAASGDFLQMAPIRSDYFQPLSEKLEVVDAVNPDVNRRAEVQSIRINDIPQEPFSGDLSATNPAAGLSDFFGPAFDGYGKPVAYGIYSQPNLIYQFRYGLWNQESVAINVYVAHFGNALSVIPPGLSGGTPFNS